MKNAAENDTLADARGRIAVGAGAALLGAGIILVTFILPAEYGVDPLGTGARFGLLELGVTGQQVAASFAGVLDTKLNLPLLAGIVLDERAGHWSGLVKPGIRIAMDLRTVDACNNSSHESALRRKRYSGQKNKCAEKKKPHESKIRISGQWYYALSITTLPRRHLTLRR